MDCQIFTM